jgi:membrane protein DedA with SNARE-associated domain
LGTLLEGETVLILAGMLSSFGYLDLHLVIPAAFLGSYGGDQCFFYLGRYRGPKILYRHPKWMSRLERIHKLLKRYHSIIIFGFRFMYGFRMITPLVLGMDREVKAGRFALLNGVSAALWSILVACAGYFLGEAFVPTLKDLKNVQLLILIGLILIAPVVFILKIRKGRASTH